MTPQWRPVQLNRRGSEFTVRLGVLFTAAMEAGSAEPARSLGEQTAQTRGNAFTCERWFMGITQRALSSVVKEQSRG